MNNYSFICLKDGVHFFSVNNISEQRAKELLEIYPDSPHYYLGHELTYHIEESV